MNRQMRYLVYMIVIGLLMVAVTSGHNQRYTDVVGLDGREYITNVGRAPFDLTAPQFNCQNFLNSLNDVQELHIAFLYNTFGNDFDCLKSILQDPRLKTLEVQLINEPCARNHRCGKYEFLAPLSVQKYTNLLKANNAGLRSKFDKYILKLQEVLAGYLQPGTELLISPGLESNLTDERAIRRLLTWAKQSFPTAGIVWNPVGGGGISNKTRIKLKADVIEGHGGVPDMQAPCVTNLDGTDINFPTRPSTTGVNNSVESKDLQNYIKTYSFCKVVFLWGHEDNGFSSLEIDPWKDPRSRTFKVGKFNTLAAKEILKAQKVLKPAAPQAAWTDQEKLSLAGCKVNLSSHDGDKKGFVWKQSDAHPGVAILLTSKEENVTSLKLWHNGKVIYVFQRVGTFGEDAWKNRPLWRSPDPKHLNIATLPYHSVLRGEKGGFCRPIDNPKVRND